MSEPKDVDLQAAHKFFSAHCFNRAWDYIDKPERSPEEENTMLQLSLASLWHWTQRADCTPTNLSVGYWQVSRVYALLHQAENARRYGQLCLEVISKETVPPYYLGMAYEALARSENVAANHEARQAYIAKAEGIAEQITDPEEKKMLLNDLATLQ